MTVRELIAELQTRDPDARVWIPKSTNGQAGLTKFVCQYVHTNVVDEAAIPDDILLLPMEMGEWLGKKSA